MDKDRLKKLCMSALDISYPSLSVSDFVVIPTFKYDEIQTDWVPDSYSLFVQMKRNGEFLNRPGRWSLFWSPYLGSSVVSIFPRTSITSITSIFYFLLFF